MLQGDLPFSSIKDIVRGEFKFRKNCSVGEIFLQLKLFLNWALKAMHMNYLLSALAFKVIILHHRNLRIDVSAARALIKECLNLNSEERLSLDDLSQHSWLTSDHSSPSKNFTKQRKYSSSSNKSNRWQSICNVLSVFQIFQLSVALQLRLICLVPIIFNSFKCIIRWRIELSESISLFCLALLCSMPPDVYNSQGI